jgi:hypothetical protein
MAQSVSQGSTTTMAATAPTKARAVATSPITPKPRRLRTALTSLEARVMSSPVECRL